MTNVRCNISNRIKYCDSNVVVAVVVMKVPVR